MIARRRSTVAMLFIAVALGVAACGGDDDDNGGGGGENKLDTADIEDRLESGLSDDPDAPTGVGDPLTVTSVECPDEVEKKADEEFECDVEAEGGLAGDVKVTLKDEEGEEVDYEMKVEGENQTFEKTGSL